jgi:hypothetical protein
VPSQLEGIDEVEFHRAGSSGCGYFKPEAASAALVLDALGQGYGRSKDCADRRATDGLQVIGSCNRDFQSHLATTGQRYDLSIVLEQFNNVRCAFAQDGNWITVLLSLFDGLDTVLDKCPAWEGAFAS